MTKIQILFPMAACFLATLFTHNASLAQESEQKRVAIIDVARIFEEDEALGDQIQALKELAKKAAETKADAEEDTRSKTDDINTQMLEKEADAYADCYVRMTSAIGLIAKQYNINLVLRADTRSLKPEDRDDLDSKQVMERINNFVVFQDKLDLTNLVIKTMKERSNSSTISSQKLPDRSPRFCDQCGQNLVKKKSDCACQGDEAGTHAHGEQDE